MEKALAAERSSMTALGVAMLGGFGAIELVGAQIAASLGHAPALGRPGVFGLYPPQEILAWLLRLNQTRPSSAQFYEAQVLCSAILGGSIPSFVKRGKPRPGRVLPEIRSSYEDRILSLTLGKTTGAFVDSHHLGAARAGQEVQLVNDRDRFIDDISRNIMIYGATGFGKTGLIAHLLREACEQDCGSLILDLKGDFYKIAQKIGEQTGRRVRLIGYGEGRERINVLGGVTSHMAASMMRSVLVLQSHKDNNASFWNITASNLVGSALTLLSLAGTGHYSLIGAYRYLFDNSYTEARNEEITTRMNSLRVESQSSKAASIAFDDATRAMVFIGRFFHPTDESGEPVPVDPMFHNGVRMQLDTALAGFVTSQELEEAFCDSSSQGVDAVLGGLFDGDVVVLSCPFAKFGDQAQVVYSFAKLLLYYMIDGRGERGDLTEAQLKRLVLLIVDEAHLCISAGQGASVSDTTFYAMSRSKFFAAVFAVQGISSLDHVVGEVARLAITQNFLHTIVFNVVNPPTVKEMCERLGSPFVPNESISKPRRSLFSKDKSGSSSISTSVTRQAVLDPNDFRSRIGDNQALYSGFNSNVPVDDIIDVYRYYP